MKKFLILTAFALAACGQSMDVAQHDKDFSGCERIETNRMHLVYKCPSDNERFAGIKNEEPNVLFISGGNLIWDDVNADTDHIYVEVVPTSDGCDADYHYRVMVKPFNTETREYFAVTVCNQ